MGFKFMEIEHQGIMCQGILHVVKNLKGDRMLYFTNFSHAIHTLFISFHLYPFQYDQLGRRD